MNPSNKLPPASTAYDILGIPKDSPETVVKQAYKRLALLYHPDKAGPAATAAFQEIDAASRAVINRKQDGEEEGTSPGHSSQGTTSHKSPKPEPQSHKPAWCTETDFLRLHWLLEDYLATARRTRSRTASPWVLSKEEKVNQWLQEMVDLYHKRIPGFEAELYSKIGLALKALRAIKIATAPTLVEATRLCLWLSFPQMLSIIGISASLSSAMSVLWKLGDASPEASWRPEQSNTSSSSSNSKFPERFQWGYGTE
ncbi:DnaJ subfamily C member 27 [Exophiala xenobiotica]|uniref:DnaJ subfamily C member 27 n=1 Tax=Lithohypha guttulata TaxID=1690604 RepID=A0ABR0KKS9_9EURO|nr:DnaJ subfamily C member 27 [Lithohypha guttulata]KAK5325418.1 DnaJ subfamily C member 27 [Exophiala xenobiotica]